MYNRTHHMWDKTKFKKFLTTHQVFKIFGLCGLFYTSIYFIPNNKIFLFVIASFLLITRKHLGSWKSSFFITYLLLIPVDKGKTFTLTMIPSHVLIYLFNTGNTTLKEYVYSASIFFSDMAFLGLIASLAPQLRRRIQKPINTHEALLIIFLSLSGIAVIFSKFQFVSFLATLRLTRVAVVFFIISFVSSHEKKLKKFILPALAGTAIFEGAWSIIQLILRRPLGRPIEATDAIITDGLWTSEDRSIFRAQGTLDHPNALGVFSLLMFVFFFVTAIKTKNLEEKKLSALAAFFSAGSLVASLSRANWVVALLIIVWLFFTNRSIYLSWFKKTIKNKFFLLCSIVLCIVALFFIAPRVEQLTTTFYSKWGGLRYRQFLLEKAVSLSEEYPLGMGLATFPAILIEKFYFFAWPPPVHNLFAEILVETGLANLCVFLLFIISVWKKSKKLAWAPPYATLAILITANFYPMLWSSRSFEYLWLFLGMMV